MNSPDLNASPSADEETCVHLSVHVDAGAPPEGSSAQLVDDVIAHSDATPGTQVSVAVPAGNAEMVERLHDVLEEEETRRAGATVIVEGMLPPER